MLISRLANYLRETFTEEKVHLIALDGCSGSGKSTLASRLSSELKCPIVELDDFLSWGDLTSWWPRFELQVIQPNLSGKTARFQMRDWENDWHGDSFREWKETPSSRFVILDGVGASRREIFGRLSLSIWVDADNETRLARGLSRDQEFEGSSELWQDWQKLEDDFFSKDPCRERAHLVIDGEAKFSLERGEIRLLTSRLPGLDREEQRP